MSSLEAVLQTLIDRVSPGEVRLNVPRAAWLREYASYEVSVQTRGNDDCFTGKTIGEAIRSAATSFESPVVEGDLDPIVPSWYRVSRMQREMVERTLERHHARHMANAAAANIRRSPEAAQAEYAMADAFKAAMAALDYTDTDAAHGPLEQEELAPRDPASAVVAKNEEVERAAQRSKAERERRVAVRVKELREKNRVAARGSAAAARGPGPSRTKA